MKKALFIAYYYPPYGGGGVQRTTKYVKYLRAYGWEPVVLTIDEDKIPLRDESLLKDVPKDQEILRTNIWSLERISKLLPRRKAAPVSEQAVASSFLKRLVRKALKGIFLLGYTFVFYPDDKIGWYPYAVRKGKERMAAGDIDLIYTTSAPFTAHLIGLSLKKSTGKPWVADLRDPWAGNKYLPFSRLRQPLDRMVEGFCIHHADKVITVSEPLREELAHTYPQQDSDKFLVISNGYDEDDLVPELRAEMSQGDRPLTMTFSYTGSFYNKISPRYFLKAMDELLREGKLRDQDVRIQFTGQFGVESMQLITAFRTAHSGVIEVSGYVPHLEATERMLAADVLLLILNKDARRGVLTGKIFEYLGSGKPVLALIPEGLASELLLSEKAAVVIDPDDQAGIKRGIMEYYRRWQSGRLTSTTDREIAGQYSRKELAGRLARVFDALT